MYYLFKRTSITRRRQSPTKLVIGISTSQQKEKVNVAKKRLIKSTSWNTSVSEEMNSDMRTVLYVLVALWVSFIFGSILQYNRHDNIEEKMNVVREKKIEFMKTFKNAPLCHQIDSENVDYTLVTHSSEDRLWMMEHHCLRWGLYNPISLAILTNMDTDEIFSKLEAFGCRRISIIIKTISLESNNNSSVADYPINALRNLALSSVKTSHAFLVDIDFLPSENLFEHLNQHHIKDAFATDNRQAIVVPAFQLNRGCPYDEECSQVDIQRMPYSRNELKQLIRQGSATIFDPTNRGGHGTTNYRAWFNESNQGLIDIPCIKSKRYEPFVVIRFCGSIPPFQERFNGYGKNKLSWIQHIAKAGYIIDQVDYGFIIHFPHKDSSSRQRWNQRPDVLKHNMKVDELDEDSVNWSEYKRGRVDALYVEFNKWLESNIKDETRTPMCEKHETDMNLWVYKHN